MSRDNALCGPWVAVLSDSHGEVYPDLATAVLEMGVDGSVDIAVVRGTAAPDPNVIGASRPGSHASGDVLYEIEDVYLDDPDDPSVGAEHRWTQAQAVAAALNGWRDVHPEGSADDQIRQHQTYPEDPSLSHDEIEARAAAADLREREQMGWP